MLKYKSDKTELKKYLEANREKLETMDEETYHVIGVLLHEEKRLEKYRKKEKVGTGMCRAIEEMIEDGRIQGQIEGKAEGEKAGENKEKIRIAKELKGLLPDEVIAEKTKLSLEIVKEL